jgi:hypothetical protein
LGAAFGAAAGAAGCSADASDIGEAASATETTVTAIRKAVIGLTSTRLERDDYSLKSSSRSSSLFEHDLFPKTGFPLFGIML